MLATNDDFARTRDSLLVYRPPQDGALLVRVADANADGGWKHVYRATIGEVPVLTSVFPLGRPRGSAWRREVQGANLEGEDARRALARRSTNVPTSATGTGRAVWGASLVNRLEVAVGTYPRGRSSARATTRSRRRSR